MLLFLLIPASLLVIGLLYQWAGASIDRKRYPPPGRVISCGESRLHVRISGQGSPAVVFESGIAASSVNWTPVQNAVSAWTSTASYDRPGFAWSESSRRPLTPGEMNDLCRELMTKAGLRPPYVLVGHSFGGLLARLYASRWPAEVAGLVLVDPALLLEWSEPAPHRLRMLGRGVVLSRRGALLARIGFVRLSLKLLSSGRRALPQLFSKLSSGKGHSVAERLVGEVRKLPPELWPAVQSHWCCPKSFDSMSWHLAALPALAAEVALAKPLGRIPVTVISGGHLSAEACAEHEAISRSSERGKHIIASGCGHWVHLDQPSIVLDAIRDMLRNDG
jgi:pimeloyl-ACP methyl ester carboxylesterase